MEARDAITDEKPAFKTAEIRQAVEQATAILKAAGAEEVYVFGSAIEGPLHPGSDIDLAVAGLPPERFFPALGQTMLALSRPLDLVDLDSDTPFARYLRKKGKLYRVA